MHSTNPSFVTLQRIRISSINLPQNIIWGLHCSSSSPKTKMSSQQQISICGSTRVPHCSAPELMEELAVKEEIVVSQNKVKQVRDKLVMLFKLYISWLKIKFNCLGSKMMRYWTIQCFYINWSQQRIRIQDNAFQFINEVTAVSYMREVQLHIDVVPILYIYLDFGWLSSPHRDYGPSF